MSLVLSNIRHRFGRVAAVHDASLEVEAGEIVCLFGHSGCGKTTLLRIAAGLEPVQSGTVALGGNMLADGRQETPPEQRPIGFVFQDYVLFPHLTVEKNIAFGVKGMSNARGRVQEQLDAFELSDLARRYPHELSGGQQQRVALARAMARTPQALLMDEPFASIDVTLRKQLRGELRRVLKKQNVAVLLVTHDAEEALALGDRIALMRAGQIIETATSQALFANPQTLEGAGVFPGCQAIDGEVRSGTFHCVLGSTNVSHMPDGNARCILRFGALGATEDEAGGFSVVDVRFTGPDWSVALEPLGSAPAATSPIIVRMDKAPPLAAKVALSLDWSRAFIFPHPAR